MCGRYYIAEEDAAEELRSVIERLNRQNSSVKCSGEIFPSDTVPVAANDRSLRRAAFAMKWGYTLPGGRLLINARSETAAEKPLFREGMKEHRCLIPASRYFEWERGSRVKYAIGRTGGEMFYLAGLYRMEAGKPVFTMLTRAPLDSIAFIHDRMPVMLPKEAGTDWLNLRYNAEDVLRAALREVSFRAQR